MSFEKQDYTRQKESAGKSATFAWIGFGIYLFIVTDRANFLSWQAAVYFIVGMFAAALVFGIAGYIVQRLLAKVLMLVSSVPTRTVAVIASGIGLFLFLGKLFLVYLTAEYAITNLLFPISG